METQQVVAYCQQKTISDRSRRSALSLILDGKELTDQQSIAA